MMPASASAPVVGPQATPLVGHLPTSRITPLWGKGDPPISVTGMLPRPWKDTSWQEHMATHMFPRRS